MRLTRLVAVRLLDTSGGGGGLTSGLGSKLLTGSLATSGLTYSGLSVMPFNDSDDEVKSVQVVLTGSLLGSSHCLDVYLMDLMCFIDGSRIKPMDLMGVEWMTE